jgi:hypothetical protein
MKQQPQGLVSVSGVVQGSESPSSYVPQNQPEQGMFYWMDVQGLVSDSGNKTLWQACCAALIQWYSSSMSQSANVSLERLVSTGWESESAILGCSAATC